MSLTLFAHVCCTLPLFREQFELKEVRYPFPQQWWGLGSAPLSILPAPVPWIKGGPLGAGGLR
eukprot:754141-Amphidinium_carterae.1